MTEHTSVLSDDEWASLRKEPPSLGSSHEAIAAWLSNSYHYGAEEANDAMRIIAAMNDRLPNGNPAKITREKLATLEQGLDLVPRASDEDHVEYTAASELLVALARYLPLRT